MEPVYAYEATCGMAQKAGALITPVVSRNGCAEDLQEVGSSWLKVVLTSIARRCVLFRGLLSS